MMKCFKNPFFRFEPSINDWVTTDKREVGVKNLKKLVGNVIYGWPLGFSRKPEHFIMIST